MSRPMPAWLGNPARAVITLSTVSPARFGSIPLWTSRPIADVMETQRRALALSRESATMY